MNTTEHNTKRIAAIQFAEKLAGWKTELGSMVNPLNLVGPGHVGALSAGFTPTRTLDEQGDADDETWANMLIPGRGPYNSYKRLGAMQDSPEMKQMQEDAKRERLQKLIAEAQSGEEPVEKQAGNISEFLSALNPANMYGGSLGGGGAAYATDTRSLKDQAEFDSNDGVARTLANLLVPGVGPYNTFKRLGASIRSPEMLQRGKQRKAREAQKELDELKGKSEATAEEVVEKTAALMALIRAQQRS